MTLIFVLASLLIVKHFICDFILQSDKMITEKGTYGAEGGLAHAAVHAFGTTIVLFIVLPWNLGAHSAAIMLGTLDGLIHYHIDWIKTNLTKGYAPADKEFWIYLGADQTLHYLTYLGLIAILRL